MGPAVGGQAGAQHTGAECKIVAFSGNSGAPGVQRGPRLAARNPLPVRGGLIPSLKPQVPVEQGQDDGGEQGGNQRHAIDVPGQEQLLRQVDGQA